MTLLRTDNFYVPFFHLKRASLVKIDSLSWWCLYAKSGWVYQLGASPLAEGDYLKASLAALGEYS